MLVLSIDYGLQISMLLLHTVFSVTLGWSHAEVTLMSHALFRCCHSHLQFSLRVGSESSAGACPAPRHPRQAVLLQVSCNGGISWSLLQRYFGHDFTQPTYVSAAGV